jgi:hypothetical protein
VWTDETWPTGACKWEYAFIFRYDVFFAHSFGVVFLILPQCTRTLFRMWSGVKNVTFIELLHISGGECGT